MNLKTWSKQHTIGLIIGVLTTLVAIPVVMMILSATNNQLFSSMWFRFKIIHDETSRIISLASIANLIWFHTYLRKEKYPFAMGVIIATVINLFVILYFKFFA